MSAQSPNRQVRAVADFTVPLRNGSDCDEPSDCPGQQCCSLPFTVVNATGLCASWTTTCSDSCEGESAIGVSAGTACVDASDCGPGLSCCDCDGYLYPICQVECGWPGTLEFMPVCDVR